MPMAPRGDHRRAVRKSARAAPDIRELEIETDIIDEIERWENEGGRVVSSPGDTSSSLNQILSFPL